MFKIPKKGHLPSPEQENSWVPTKMPQSCRPHPPFPAGRLAMKVAAVVSTCEPRGSLMGCNIWININLVWMQLYNDVLDFMFHPHYGAFLFDTTLLLGASHRGNLPVSSRDPWWFACCACHHRCADRRRCANPLWKGDLQNRMLPHLLSSCKVCTATCSK